MPRGSDIGTERRITRRSKPCVFLGKHIPGRENSMCKGPEVGNRLARWRRQVALSEPKRLAESDGAALWAPGGGFHFVPQVLGGPWCGRHDWIQIERRPLEVRGRQCSLCPHPQLQAPIPPPYSQLLNHQNQSNHLLGSPTP